VSPQFTTPKPVWDFGDGSPTVKGKKVVHTYTQTGQFTVTVTATDSLGHTTTVSKPINVVS
jgi:PKD repeat protein